MVKSLREQYKPSLIAMMNFKDGNRYNDSHEFTTEELVKVNPNDIVRWMKMKVYGTPDPTEEQNPVHGRSSSLVFAKKAISSFMPNKLMQWNEMASPPAVNPTKSAAVNNLIALVKKKEVRNQG